MFTSSKIYGKSMLLVTFLSTCPVDYSSCIWDVGVLSLCGDMSLILLILYRMLWNSNNSGCPRWFRHGSMGDGALGLTFQKIPVAFQSPSPLLVGIANTENIGVL